MTDLRIERIGTLEAFRAAERAWNRLLPESSAHAVFLSWDWLYTWAEHFLGADRRLFVLAAHKGDVLAGIAPWYVARSSHGPFRDRRIGFLGSPEAGSDYLDVIVRRGEEEAVAGAIYRFLFREARAEWDSFLFRDVPADSGFFRRFLGHFDAEGKHVDAARGAFCPVASLPESREAFFRSLSANTRQKFGRQMRNIEKAGALEFVSGQGRDGTECFTAFRTLYERCRGDGGGLMRFLEAYIGRAGTEGRVRIDLMKVGGRCAAGLFHLNGNGTQSMYLCAVDRSAEHGRNASLGNLLIGACIGNAIERKVRAYDFLKGDEGYKFHWAAGGNGLMDIAHYRRSAVPVLRYAARSLKNLGKILVR